MKITTLTEEQSGLLSEYADAGEVLEFSSDPIDEAAAKEYGERLMKWLGRDYLATIICDGPIAACGAVHMLAVLEARMNNGVPDLAWDQVKARISEHVIEPVDIQVMEQTDDFIRRTIWRHIGSRWSGNAPVQVGRWLHEQCETRIWKQVKDQIWEQVKDRAWDRIAEQDNTVFPYLCGQWMAGYVAWHRYYREVLELDLSSIWQIEDQIQFGGVFPLSKFVVIFRRPEAIHRNSSGRLHCDNEPALRYADGFSLFVLNGVRVPEELAVKSAAEIDPREFAKIENAEVRREFVRKVGIERIVQACGAVVLDKQGEYELLSVDLGGSTGKWPYLKMLNPSVGVWHLEAVAKGIATVNEALKWRNQSDLLPEQLT